MITRVRQLTADDKALLASALQAAGFKARLRVFPGMIRAVITPEDFDRQALADALNVAGFRFADGRPFGRYSFNGNEAAVRYMVA